MRKSLAGLAVAAFAFIMVGVAAAPASASAPSDCTPSYPNNYTTTLTCTDRPPTQQWQFWRACDGPWLDSSAWSPIVTGNGTTTAQCEPRAFADPFVYFVIV